MGGWQLEAFKFGTCIAMPVFCFWYYHRTENMQEYYDRYYQANVTEETIESDRKIRELQQRMRELRDKRFEKELENIDAAKRKEN